MRMTDEWSGRCLKLLEGIRVTARIRTNLGKQIGSTQGEKRTCLGFPVWAVTAIVCSRLARCRSGVGRRSGGGRAGDTKEIVYEVYNRVQDAAVRDGCWCIRACKPQSDGVAQNATAQIRLDAPAGIGEAATKAVAKAKRRAKEGRILSGRRSKR